LLASAQKPQRLFPSENLAISRRFRLPEREMSKEAAYQAVQDELLLDGNPRQNLASFVTTWMEAEGEKLMAQALSKNFIDYDEYPATVEIQVRRIPVRPCVRIPQPYVYGPPPSSPYYLPCSLLCVYVCMCV
jgi:glutamate/tyrosine decarboxylase-like PLP-dependent enzyme